MTDTSTPPSPPPLPYVGQRISLISKSAIRYVGTLYTIDTNASTVALKDVRSFGTEGRKRDGGPVEPSDRVYTFIVFRGPDITDLQFLPNHSDTPAPPQNQNQNQHTLPQQRTHLDTPHHPSNPPHAQIAPHPQPQALPKEPFVDETPEKKMLEQPLPTHHQQKKELTSSPQRSATVRGPTPRAWGPPPVPPKEMRQEHVNRQPVQPAVPRNMGEGNGYLPTKSHEKEEEESKPAHTLNNPNQNPMLVASSSTGNKIYMNGQVSATTLANAAGPLANGEHQSQHAVYHAGSHHPPAVANGSGVNGANARPNPPVFGVPNGAPMYAAERPSAYRGGRGRGKARAFGGRYHAVGWRRGPGIKIPTEDFDFASMQEKFAAAAIGGDGKPAGEKPFGHIDVCYDKSKSFFDELVPEKEMRTKRTNAAQRRATDFETFGETGPGYHRGYRNGRGRRSRGRGRGRGGRLGGQGSQRNQGSPAGHGGRGGHNAHGVHGAAPANGGAGAPRQDVR